MIVTEKSPREVWDRNPAVPECPLRGQKDGSLPVAVILSGIQVEIATAVKDVEMGRCWLGYTLLERRWLRVQHLQLRRPTLQARL